MARSVKPRGYDASGRRAAADDRRARILAAARELFLARGYQATTVAAIAADAQVAVDTVYASVGRKPAVFRALVESALSGQDAPVPGEQRDYVAAMRAAPDLATKLAVYAVAVTAIQARLAPLFMVLREAAAGDAALSEVWTSIGTRRAANMRMLVADLAATGELREDLPVEQLADVVWTMNSSEYYALLVLDRGWPAERFERWLRDGWLRLLRADLSRGP